MNSQVHHAIEEARSFLVAAGMVSSPPNCVLCGSPKDHSMRRAGRRDTTHSAIRDGLRALGFSVADTAGMGDDFPDLVVGLRGQTYLIEVKGPKTPVSPGQVEFALAWRGSPVIVARSLDEALAALGVVTA